MSAEVRAQEIINRLKKFPAIGVEIGVSIGQLSEALLKDTRIHLYMVDSWLMSEEQPKRYKDSGDGHALYTQAEQEAHRRVAENVTEFARERRQILQLDSFVASERFDNQSLDFVFIDADHSYEGCKQDIEAWKDKIKPGGLLSGHDYNQPHLPDVKKAVDEAVKKYGWTLELGPEWTWFVKI